MLITKPQVKRGDTLIEVLFAIATFSLVAVGGIAIMNKGTAASQRALEITLVRNEINSQAETLRFINASYISAYKKGISSYGSDTPAEEWNTIRNNTVTMSSSFSAENMSCPQRPDGSFILNSKKAKFVSPSSGVYSQADTYSMITYDGEELTNAKGIWIEAVKSKTSIDSNQNNAAYIDFYINACWFSSGQSEPVTLGTIVRLYEPK